MAGSLNVGELIAACIVTAIGALVLWEASSYPLGTLARIGPGFFPLLLGATLVMLGGVLIVQVARLPTPPPELRLRPFVLILAGLLTFALLADRAGLIPATLALVGISGLGDRTAPLRAVAGTAVALAAIGYLVFIRGFGVALEAVRW